MAQPLSNDLRKRIVKAVDNGQSRNAAAKQYAVSISAVVKLMQRRNRTGSFTPAQQGKPPEFRLAPHEDRVREMVKERQDITLLEMRDALAKAGIAVSKSAIDRFLNHLGLGYKKNSARQRAGQAGCQGRPRCMEGRSAVS
jgi:putative transposase